MKDVVYLVLAIALFIACYAGGLAFLCWLIVTILRHLGVHI